MESTPIIFRKFKDQGDVIAIFPTIPWTIDAYSSCASYQHIGQHGDIDPWIINTVTVPANEKEYLPLLNELKSIGYKNLKIVKRITEKMITERVQYLNDYKTVR